MDYLLGSRGAGPCRACGQHSPGRWPGDRCAPCWNDRLRARTKQMQAGPTWLYRLFDEHGTLLYLGVTTRQLKDRYKEHRKTMPWWPEVARREEVLLDMGFSAAEKLELAAIQAEHPLYNSLGQEVPLGQPWRCDFPDMAAWRRAWFEWRALFREGRLTPAERGALGR